MKRLLSFFLLLLSFVLDAQDYVVVSDIVLEGNKVTKPSIIMKELTFGVGDTIDIARWDEQMRVSRACGATPPARTRPPFPSRRPSGRSA